VLPKNFWFFPAEDVCIPEGVFNRGWRTDRDQRAGFTVVGRLKPGVTLAEAKANMSTVEKRLEKRHQKNSEPRIGFETRKVLFQRGDEVSQKLRILKRNGTTPICLSAPFLKYATSQRNTFMSPGPVKVRPHARGAKCTVR
jgi:hypothetical protein